MSILYAVFLSGLNLGNLDIFASLSYKLLVIAAGGLYRWMLDNNNCGREGFYSKSYVSVNSNFIPPVPVC